MRIVLICNEYPPQPHAGIGTFVQALAHGLDSNGHTVTVVGLANVGEVRSDGNIRVITLARSRVPYLGNLISRIRLHRWLAAAVRHGLVDVVEVPDSCGLLPFRVHGCVVVVRLHQTFTGVSILSRQRVAKGISFYERRTLRTHRSWIAVSRHILGLTQSLFGVCPTRSVTIYNPVPPMLSSCPEIAELPDNYVLYAGHVCGRKGALVLAEAAKHFLTTRPDLHLLYVGGIFNEAGRSVSEQVLELVGQSLAERIHFLGHIDRASVLACMTKARVFAFPSRIEALGLVVLEAMGCGLPVVCTKNPPGPELVEDGVTGLLADPTSASDFAEKIATLLDNPALANRLAQNAKKAVSERFSLEQCVEQTEAFYRACLSESKHGIIPSAANSCVASKDKSPVASS